MSWLGIATLTRGGCQWSLPPSVPIRWRAAVTQPNRIPGPSIQERTPSLHPPDNHRAKSSVQRWLDDGNALQDCIYGFAYLLESQVRRSVRLWRLLPAALAGRTGSMRCPGTTAASSTPPGNHHESQSGTHDVSPLRSVAC